MMSVIECPEPSAKRTCKIKSLLSQGCFVIDGRQTGKSTALLEFIYESMLEKPNSLFAIACPSSELCHANYTLWKRLFSTTKPPLFVITESQLVGTNAKVYADEYLMIRASEFKNTTFEGGVQSLDGEPIGVKQICR